MQSIMTQRTFIAEYTFHDDSIDELSKDKEKHDNKTYNMNGDLSNKNIFRGLGETKSALP